MKKVMNYAFPVYWEKLKVLFLIMRLFSLLMLMGTLTVSAKSWSQQTKIDLQVQNSSVGDILLSIENGSRYLFIYDAEVINALDKKSIDVKGKNIEEVLDQLFKSTNVAYRIEDRQVFLYEKHSIPSNLFTEQGLVDVKGRVTDPSGAVLPGVSVVVKSTTNGTITDSEGNYSLGQVPDNASLVFSFVGMKTQEIPVSGKTTIDVSLTEETVGIGEVIAVGYGVQRKADLTGSVGEVKGDKLTVAPASSLSNALAGKITGVVTVQSSGTPGDDDAALYIRGQSTFGDNSALVLVDGIERDFNRINPYDIESVTVLKDAASAAIYGSRASNGVILIITKRGTRKDIEVNYTGSYGIQSPTYLPNMMNSWEYSLYYNEALANIASLTGGTYIPKYSDQEIAAFKNGTAPNTNWWSEVMNATAPIQQHNISLNRNTDKLKVFASIGSFDQHGLYSLSWYKRYHVRSNIDASVTKNFSVSLNLAGRIEKRSSSAQERNAFGNLIESLPTLSPYEYRTPDGKLTPADDPTAQKALSYNGLNHTPIGLMLHTGYNLYDTSVFESSLALNYEVPFIKGLTAKFVYSYDKSYSNTKVFNTPFEFYINGSVNKWGSIIKLDQNASNFNRKTSQFTLDYSTTIGESKLSTLFVYEQSETYNDFISAYREGFIATSIDQMFAGSGANKDNDGNASVGARKGYVGRINYNYKDKYLVQVDGRYDGSFNFASEKRWGFFPAMSLGWRINKEPFMTDVSWLTNFKLRASIGQYGNDRIAQYMFLQAFEFNNGIVAGTSPVYNAGIAPTALANADVTWETATSKNVGFDWAILNNKLSGEFDYFTKRTKNILMDAGASVPGTFGATLPFQNIGVVDNWGYEATISCHTKIQNLEISIQPNITYTNSKVINMAEAANVPDGLKQTGKPFGQRFGYVAEGLLQPSDFDPNGKLISGIVYQNPIQAGDIKYKDISGPGGTPDGKIDSYDRTRIGSSRIPKYVFGINLSLNYKNFDLFANFQGAGGYDSYRAFDGFINSGNAMGAMVDSWRVGHENARFPRLYVGQTPNNGLTSSYWLVNGSYVKLRNAELAYTIQCRLVKGIF